MDEPLEGKPVSASRIQLAQMMQPQQANNFGNVHGGVIMKLVDEAGGLACMRHAQKRVVTVAVDQLVFRQPTDTHGRWQVTTGPPARTWQLIDFEIVC
jgi:acyl-CoA hydrolase